MSVLSPEDYECWLDPCVTDPNTVQNLFRPHPGEMPTRSPAPPTTVATTTLR